MQVLIAEGALSEPIACSMFHGLTQGLSYLHDHRVVHRDIKPKNILLSCSPSLLTVAKFCDFGLARKLSMGDSCRTLCGTFFNMAPELAFALRNKSSIHYDVEVDLWSFGIVFYCGFTGEVPCSFEGCAALQISNEGLLLDESLTPEIKCIVEDLLILNPVARLSSKSLLARMLYLSPL